MTRPRHLFVPGTGAGRWSLALLGVATGAMLLFAVGVASGQRGGDEFFDNLWLTVPVLAAWLSCLASGVCGVVAVLRHRERALPVFVAIVVAAAVALFGILEVAVPH
jgi:hypothetical protein